MKRYVAFLGGDWYGYIQLYKWALIFTKTNKRRAKCIQCKQSVETGGAVRQRQPFHNGYVCISCAKNCLLKYGEMGYSENLLMNLQANNLQTGKWTAEQVVSSLREDVIEDGFGSAWSAWCECCESRSMQVVRPGVAKCAICIEPKELICQK
jgi:transposase-like protein